MVKAIHSFLSNISTPFLHNNFKEDKDSKGRTGEAVLSILSFSFETGSGISIATGKIYVKLFPKYIFADSLKSFRRK